MRGQAEFVGTGSAERRGQIRNVAGQVDRALLTPVSGDRFALAFVAAAGLTGPELNAWIEDRTSVDAPGEAAAYAAEVGRAFREIAPSGENLERTGDFLNLAAFLSALRDEPDEPGEHGELLFPSVAAAMDPGQESPGIIPTLALDAVQDEGQLIAMVRFIGLLVRQDIDVRGGG